MDVNLGIPTGLSGGLIKEVESPIFATGVGLILHKIKVLNESDYIHNTVAGHKRRQTMNPKSILQKIKSWFDNL
jgi:cell division protein FtsA